MRVYLESYGCAQNQGEAHSLVRALSSAGHSLDPDPATADVGVLVTCGVIGSTEARMVRRWRALSERIPRVVVTGCLVPLRTDLLTGPGRDRTTFLPIREQSNLPALLSAWDDSSSEVRTGPPLPVAGPAPATAEVVIAQGCTSHCTYCFSRLARGRLTSKPQEKVVWEIEEARDRGAVEVRLTSLDTSCWGLDSGADGRLPNLLQAIDRVPGRFRVRVGMMSPQSLAPIVSEFLKVLRSERFYRFLHLPVQSGSDSVLRRMSRGYRALDFREIVASARAVLPDLMLATDVIIGFPGETDEDFRATLDLLREVGPDLVNVTRFSPRPLTPAGGMLPVPSATVKRRSREITSLRQEQSRARFEQWIGRTERILIVENGIEQSSMGRLPNYLPVVVDRTLPIGAETSVRIEGARSTYLLGEPVGPLENRPAPRAE